MLITAIRSEGLAPPQAARGLDRVVTLPRGPAGWLMADAVTLWAATLAPLRLPEALGALGAASSAAAVDVTVEDGWLAGASWDREGALASLLAPGERRFGIEVTVELDPTLFADLREHAVRDPRLVSALGESLTLVTKIGWVLTAGGLATQTIGLLGLSVGGVSFPVSGKERAAWAPAFLAKVGARVARIRWQQSVGEVARSMLSSATSSDPEQRQRAHRAAAALSRAPFRWGRYEAIDLGEEVIAAFGPQLIRADRLGPAARHALQLVQAVIVDQPDVLIVDGAGAGFQRPGAIVRWLGRYVHGADATLEQVFLVPGGG